MRYIIVSLHTGRYGVCCFDTLSWTHNIHCATVFDTLVKAVAALREGKYILDVDARVEEIP